MPDINPIAVEVTNTRWSTTIQIADVNGYLHEYHYALPWRSRYRRSHPARAARMTAQTGER